MVATPVVPPPAVIRVGELNALVRQTLERDFPLQWVAGEISNLTRAASGHLYFTLKDDAAQARCVMFRSRAQLLPWRLENGQQVEARVLVSLYEARGDFQLNVEQVRQAGLGRLYEAFAQLKARLAVEGLFAAERKRALPRFPARIGIVTSPAAAALRDVLIALRRRAPHVPCMIYPTLVQGELAAEGVARAIALANERRECDVLLVVRGGGSIEDLWAFNEEAVARAIAASALPVVAGVGHETDTTIADFVADLRAPTPTAAAELVSQGWFAARAGLANLRAELLESMRHRLDTAQQRLDHLALRLTHPATRLARDGDRLRFLSLRLAAAMNANAKRKRADLGRISIRLERCRPRFDGTRGRLNLLHQQLTGAMSRRIQINTHSLARLKAGLEHLNPDATLLRGFAIVRAPDGTIVNSADQLEPGARIALDFAVGQAEAEIIRTTKNQVKPFD